MGLHQIILKLHEMHDECPYDLEALETEFGSWEAIMDEVHQWDTRTLVEKVKMTPCVKGVLAKWTKKLGKNVGVGDPNPKLYKSRFPRRRGHGKDAGKWYKTAGEAAEAVCAWIGSRSAGSPGSKGVKNNPRSTARRSSVDDPGATLAETKPSDQDASGKYYGFKAPFAAKGHDHWGESEKRHGASPITHKGRKKRQSGKGVSKRARKALAKKRKGPPPKSGLTHRATAKEPF